jgi:hypothetical protein
MGVFVEKTQTEKKTSTKEPKRRLGAPDKILQSYQLVVQASAYGESTENVGQRRSKAAVWGSRGGH